MDWSLRIVQICERLHELIPVCLYPSNVIAKPGECGCIVPLHLPIFLRVISGRCKQIHTEVGAVGPDEGDHKLLTIVREEVVWDNIRHLSRCQEPLDYVSCSCSGNYGSSGQLRVSVHNYEEELAPGIRAQNWAANMHRQEL